MSKDAPVVGILVPPAHGEVPPEPVELYPEIEFIATGLGLERMNEAGYGNAIERTAEAAKSLKERGADAIFLMGTSISFFRGHAFNDEIEQVMREATGLPAKTLSTAIIEALKEVGGRRLAAGTAYTEPVNRMFRAYVEPLGFDILSLKSLNIEDVDDVLDVTDDDLVELGLGAARAAPEADAMIISCGGLRTIRVTVPLEEQTGLPVVSSAMAGARTAAQLVGHSGRAEGYGRLFELEAV
jgi:arylmalonate decarboxylase